MREAATSTDVVGRETELVALAGLLTLATSGLSTLVLEGAAGAGKTTLWLAGVSLASQRGIPCLACRPSDTEAPLSFAALGDLLERVPAQMLAELPDPQRRALDVALLLEEPGERAPDQRAIGLALLGVLRSLTRSGPALVAVDDVQWLDAASASALQFALRRLETEPVAFLFTLRTDPRDRASPGLERVLTELSAPRLRLGPLSLGALHRLLRTRLGVSFSRPVLRRVHAAAGGSPLYALELARALERRGGTVDPGRPLPVPGTLRELMEERLAGLSPATEAALGVVAAVTDPTRALLEAAGQDPLSVDAAVDAGVLELDGERIRFTHPLLGSVVYAGLGEPARRVLHRRLAPLVDTPEERARHLALSAAAADARIAAALDEGARDAARRGAQDAAAELHELAARLTTPEDADDARRRLLAAAECHVAAGDPERARSILAGLAERLPKGRARAEVLSLLACHQAVLPEAARLATQALAEASEDVALRARIHRDLTVVQLVMGDLEGSAAAASTAAALAEQIGDVPLQASALARYSYAETLLGHGIPPEAERAVELAGPPDELSAPLTPSFNLATLLSRVDELDRARQLLRSELRRVEAAGNEEARGDVLYHLADLELRAGDWAAAAWYAEECRTLARQAGNEQERAAATFPAALVDAHRGHVEDARAAAAEGLSVAKRLGDRIFEILHRGVLGFCALSLGDPRAADEAFAPATELLDRMGVREFAFFPVVQHHIEALAAIGALDQAEALAALVEESGRRLDRPWALMVAARGRALVHAARGETESAKAEAESALAESARVPQPFERARTALVAGTIERRAKHRRASRELLGEALHVFEELGAPLWAAKAQAELDRLGGRRPAGTALTPTERRVAELVARGLSNKQVAAETFTTTRTVEGHLTRIYAKLEVRSRAELASRLSSGAESQGVSGISS